MFGRKKKDDVKPLETYKVGYLGGDPRYPKAKKTIIHFNLCEDTLVIDPAKWFDGLEVPYERIKDIVITDRQVSGLDLLSTGLLGAVTLKQANNINVAYLDENDNERIICFEMFSGGSVWGTAKKCQEMLDRLIHHQIKDRFIGLQTDVSSTPAELSPLEKIEKLSELKDKGIISDDDFEKKKMELLDQM